MSKADEEYYFKLEKRLALKDYQIRQDAKEIQELKEEVKRENKSHNYHCKESQRKNDVIHDLEALILEAIYFAKLSGLGQEWLVANKEKLKKLE